jgi:hypothetical protein
MVAARGGPVSNQFFDALWRLEHAKEVAEIAGEARS